MVFSLSACANGNSYGGDEEGTERQPPMIAILFGCAIMPAVEYSMGICR